MHSVSVCADLKCRYLENLIPLGLNNVLCTIRVCSRHNNRKEEGVDKGGRGVGCRIHMYYP